MRHALVLSHLAFEDLGLIGPLLDARGIKVEFISVPQARMDMVDLISPDLLIILGGPIGVYDHVHYPFLTAEIQAIRERLLGGGPILGLCLGAQLIAAALGASVYPAADKEIGFKPVQLTQAGRTSPLASLGDGVPVLHWHGDTFDLPPGAELLASTELCENQAFAIGPRILGLQFHLEVAPADLEAWLVGHAVELHQAAIDPRDLRKAALLADARLGRAARAAFTDWLHGAGL